MRRSSVYQDYLRPAKVDSLIQKYAYNLTVGDQVSDGSTDDCMYLFTLLLVPPINSK